MLVVNVLITLLVILFAPAIVYTDDLEKSVLSTQTTGHGEIKLAQNKEKPKSYTYLRLTPKQYKMYQIQRKTNKECWLVCTNCQERCIPGCDPPDENNTVHGCSPCYTKEIICKCYVKCK